MKFIKRLLVCVAVLLAVLVVFVIYAFHIEPLIWEHTHRKEAFAILDNITEAHRNDGLLANIDFIEDDAVCVIYSDDRWIALYYNCACRRGKTVGIARDSEGNWYETKNNYCAMFKAAKSETKNIIMGRYMAETEGDKSFLWPSDREEDLGSATLFMITPSFDGAKAHMEDLGFYQISR